MNVALHARRGHQDDGLATYAAQDFTEHDHSFGSDIALNLPLLIDDNLGAGYVTLEFAIDLYLALADDLQLLASDLEAGVDYHSGLTRHDAYPLSGETLMCINLREGNACRAWNPSRLRLWARC